MRTRLLRSIGVAVMTTVTAMVAFGGTASAQTEPEPSPADDLAIIGENLPTAVEELVAGLEAAATTATETQSAVETSAALGQALVDTGSALVADTEQFGALGLGLLLADAAVQQGLAPYLGAIDGDVDPSELVSMDDPQALLDNVAPALEITVDNVTTALAEGAQGNFVEPGLLDPATGTPALVGNIVALGGGLSSNGVAFTLLQGTSFEGLGTLVPVLTLVGGGAAGGFAGEYLVDLEDSLGSALADSGEYTGPLVAILQTL